MGKTSTLGYSRWSKQREKPDKGQSPGAAIKQNIAELKQKYPLVDVLPEDGLYCYLYLPGEQHGDQKKRAPDLNWSKDTFRFDRIVQVPGNWMMCYTKDGLQQAFVYEELMLVTEDMELPP